MHNNYMYTCRILVMVGGRASDQMEKLDYFQKATVRYIFSNTWL